MIHLFGGHCSAVCMVCPDVVDMVTRPSAQAPPRRVFPPGPRTLPAVLLGWDADSTDDEVDERPLSPYGHAHAATGTSTALALLLGRITAPVSVPCVHRADAQRRMRARKRTQDSSDGCAGRKCARVTLRARCVHCSSIVAPRGTAPDGTATCATCATLDDCAVVLRLHAMC